MVDRINPGYEWVFDDEDTIAVEKLDWYYKEIEIYDYKKGGCDVVENQEKFD